MKNTCAVFSFSRLLHARAPSLSLFQNEYKNFQDIFFIENTSVKLLLFFTEDGLAFARKMMIGYLSRKHNVAIAEKRVDTTLSLVSPQFRAQRTSTTRVVNIIPYRAD